LPHLLEEQALVRRYPVQSVEAFHLFSDVPIAGSKSLALSLLHHLPDGREGPEAVEVVKVPRLERLC